jgi:hypothetical protein
MTISFFLLGLLLVINGYFISDYYWLLVVILLMVIDGYYINGY